MDLHENQIEAVNAMETAVVERHSLLIKGKAGTGKSTVVKEGLVRVAEVSEDRDVISTCFTNKGVLRMVEIGFPKENAMTCNSLLYQTGVFMDVHMIGLVLSVNAETVAVAQKHRRRSDEDKARIAIAGGLVVPDDCGIDPEDLAKDFLDQVSMGNFESRVETTLKDDYDPSDIIIVDEVGILPLHMAEQIMERYETVIFMGDHRQLPPVDGPDTINVIEPFDTVELTHVFRSGSKILQWADLAERDELGAFPAVSIRDMPELADDDWQVIVYTNADVFNVSHGIRSTAGIMGRPQPGEPLIAFSAMTALNKVQDTREEEQVFRKWLKDAGRKVNYEIEAHPSDPDLIWRTYRKKIFKNTMFKATGPAFNHEGEIMIGVDLGDGLDWYAETIDFWNLNPGEFNTARKTGLLNCFFAYAITCHRAQGSEMPNVLVKVRDKVSEQWRGDKERSDMERPRWNYSATTRAKDTLKLCSNIVF